MKLIQKHFLKGTREFEIIDDAVFVRTKGLLKEEKLTIGLNMLNPEPVFQESELTFYSRNKTEPMLSLLLNKPSAETFSAFVDELKRGISGNSEESFGTDVKHDTAQPEAPGWNVYEEPLGFEDEDEPQDKIIFKPVNAQRIESDINMLKTYMDEDTISPLIDALESLKAQPEDERAFQEMLDIYKNSDINQGAILTYAPYLKVLLSQSVWS